MEMGNKKKKVKKGICAMPHPGTHGCVSLGFCSPAPAPDPGWSFATQKNPTTTNPSRLPWESPSPPLPTSPRPLDVFGRLQPATFSPKSLPERHESLAGVRGWGFLADLFASRVFLFDFWRVV